MSAFQNTAEQVGILAEYSKQYVEQKITTTKLDVAEKSAKLIAELASWGIALALGMISVLFLLVALVFVVNLWVDSMALAFVIVGILTLVLSSFTVLFRRAFFTNPILSFIIELIFEEDEE